MTEFSIGHHCTGPRYHGPDHDGSLVTAGNTIGEHTTITPDTPRKQASDPIALLDSSRCTTPSTAKGILL